jgi:hypothetical protein
MTVQDRAAEVASARLERAAGFLRTLREDERRVVERVAYAVAAGVAECLVEEAERNPAIAAALPRDSGSKFVCAEEYAASDFVALSHKPPERDGPRGSTGD